MKKLTLLRSDEGALEKDVASVTKLLNIEKGCVILDCGALPLSMEKVIEVTAPETLQLILSSECLTLKHLWQDIDKFTADTSVNSIVLINSSQCLDRDKTTQFVESHRVFNESMLKLRKAVEQRGISVVLVESRHATVDSVDMVSYYADARYVFKKGVLVKAL